MVKTSTHGVALFLRPGQMSWTTCLYQIFVALHWCFKTLFLENFPRFPFTH